MSDPLDDAARRTRAAAVMYRLRKTDPRLATAAQLMMLRERERESTRAWVAYYAAQRARSQR
jgi:hypothetical protein